MAVRRSSRPPWQRALLPVVGGLLFFALLGLAMWGIAALLSDNPDRVNESLARTTFPVGGTASIAAVIEDDGPLLFQGLMGDRAERSIVLDHTGDDVRQGWRAYFAYPADRAPECQVQQIRRTRTFEDCDGRTVAVEQLAPPEGVLVVVGETVTIDLTGATSVGSTVGSTVAPGRPDGSRAPGTGAPPTTSDSP